MPAEALCEGWANAAKVKEVFFDKALCAYLGRSPSKTRDEPLKDFF